MNIGHAIRAERRRQNTTQEWVSSQSGVTRQCICEIERGVRGVSLRTLEKIAGALGVRVSELVKEAEEA